MDGWIYFGSKLGNCYSSKLSDIQKERDAVHNTINFKNPKHNLIIQRTDKNVMIKKRSISLYVLYTSRFACSYSGPSLVLCWFSNFTQ